MNTTGLVLILLLSGFQKSAAHALLTVTPDRAQFFEYEEVSISCQPGWTVWRLSSDRSRLSPCSSGGGGCSLKVLKPSHSGRYWCQSRYGDTSRTASIRVTERPVLLQSPVLPVGEGGDLSLSCQTRTPPSGEASFYRDGVPIGGGARGHMTLSRVSRGDEGNYSCRIKGLGESEPSRLLLRDDSPPAVLSVWPPFSSVFEYEKLTLRCSSGPAPPGGPAPSGSPAPSGGPAPPGGWRLARHTFSGQVPDAWRTLNASQFVIQTAKKHDSGVYWCESHRQRSAAVNIHVHDEPLLLKTPYLPVGEGGNLSLSCVTRTPPSGEASFYRDGVPIGGGARGHMTLSRVSRGDEGNYSCSVGGGRSPPSRVLVRVAAAPPAGGRSPGLGLLRYLLVCSPYLVCTALIPSVWRAAGRKAAVTMTTPPRQEEAGGQEPDEATTEHSF